MKIETKIPQSLNDLQLWQYQKYTALLNENKEADIDFLNRKALEIFYGIDSKYYNDMKVSDIDYLISSLNTVLAMQPVFQNRFEMDGIKYGFIPNLDEITFGELISVDSNNTIDKWHLMMGILFRPISEEQTGNRYKIEKYEPRKDLKNITLGIALGAVAFFFDLGNDLLSFILKSTQVKDQVAKQKQGTGLSGGGMIHSLRLVMGTLKSLMTLRIPQRTNVYTT